MRMPMFCWTYAEKRCFLPGIFVACVVQYFHNKMDLDYARSRRSYRLNKKILHPSLLILVLATVLPVGFVLCSTSPLVIPKPTPNKVGIVEAHSNFTDVKIDDTVGDERETPLISPDENRRSLSVNEEKALASFQHVCSLLSTSESNDDRLDVMIRHESKNCDSSKYMDETKFCKLMSVLRKDDDNDTGRQLSVDKTMFRSLLSKIKYSLLKANESLVSSYKSDVDAIDMGRITSGGLKTMYLFDDSYKVKNQHLSLHSTRETLSKLIPSLHGIVSMFDVDGDGELNVEEKKRMTEYFLSKNSPKENFSDLLCANLPSRIDELILEVLGKKKFIQPAHKNVPISLRAFLDPVKTPASIFVEKVEHFSFNHPALHHSFLRGLGDGSYDGGAGSKRGCHLIIAFLDAYRCATCGFRKNVVSLKQHLGGSDPTIEENLAEELGIYDESKLNDIKSLGIEPGSIDRVPHSELFERTVAELREKCGLKGYGKKSETNSAMIADELVSTFTDLCGGEESSPESALSCLYFGSELIAPALYKTILRAIEGNIGNLDQCTYGGIFFRLHMELDVEHANKFREMVLPMCETIEGRIKIAASIGRLMEARLSFMCKAALELTKEDDERDSMSSSKLYNKQSSNWVRTKPSCLSDFTGRPHVFRMCKRHISDTAWVLDVGCGEGFPARELTKMGVGKIVGIDVSEGMVSSAQDTAKKMGFDSKQTFLCGNASNVKKIIDQNYFKVGVLPGSVYEKGIFDLATAIFLFNYLSTQDTGRVIEEVFSLLRPGGSFIFSVPHPLMAYLHDENENSSNSSFSFNAESFGNHYFSRRDNQLRGVIKTTEGTKLNVRMVFKTISDYVNMIKESGFELIEMHEAHVEEHHMERNPDFFSSVNDMPLHLIFEVRKPLNEISPRDSDSNSLYDLLKVKLPFFIFYELIRPIKRFKSQTVRNDALVNVLNLLPELRKEDQTDVMPIFELIPASGKAIWHYERDDIERGFSLDEAPPLLQYAMDILDKQIYNQKLMKEYLLCP